MIHVYKNTLIKAVAYLFLFFISSAQAQTIIPSAYTCPVGSSMGGVAYGNSLYVAVGSSGYIIKSTDAQQWSIVATAASFLNVTYNRVVYGNSKFVAITSDGKVVTSTDGTNWTQQTSGTTNMLNDIIYAGGKFLAVGNNGTAISSADGITWSAVTTGAGASDALMSVIYTGSKFYIGCRDAANSGCVVYSSSTGNSGTFSSVVVTTNPANSLNRLCCLNTTFYIFTSSTAIYSSANGSSWSAVSNTRLTGTNQVFHGIYDGTTYYLFGSSTEYGYGSVFTSTDGINYSLQAKTTSLVAQNSAYVNGKYFQLGNEGIVVSTNGSNWAFPSGSYSGLASDGSIYVAVGQTTGSDASIFTTTDWSTWTSRAVTAKPLFGVTYGGGKFVAVGNIDASSFGTVCTSADGITWSSGNSGIADNLRAVAYGNSKFVAVGFNGRIIYSSNGTSWTSAESVTGYNYYGVSYVNNYFVAVGGSTTANTGMVKVKYSSDGVTWTDVSPSIVGHFHAVAYGGGKYLLVGRDNTTGSQKFFSVTSSNITSSANFSSAVTATTPEGDVGTLGFGAVSYGNGTFAALVNLKVSPFSAYVLTSVNGSSWTATTANTTGRLRSIMIDGSNFKFIGTNDTKMTLMAGTLPLMLLSFNATLVNKQAHLQWRTSGEEDTRNFEIEYSTGGDSFIKIGSLNAAGNSNGVREYSFVHTQPALGNNYYRLKMIDKNDNAEYSQISMIRVNAQSAYLQLYPNPVTDNKLFADISGDVKIPAAYTVYDLSGRPLLNGTIQQHNQPINTESLKKGTYIVKLSNGLSGMFVKP